MDGPFSWIFMVMWLVVLLSGMTFCLVMLMLAGATIVWLRATPVRNRWDSSRTIAIHALCIWPPIALMCVACQFTPIPDWGMSTLVLAGAAWYLGICLLCRFKPAAIDRGATHA
jgi:hypothetical protein